MKKLVILSFMVFALGMSAFAQKALISSNAAALIPTVDTVTNTGSKYMTLPLSTPVTGPKQTVTISAVATLISGTGAGTVILQGSIDGVNYSTIAASQLQGAQTATFTLTNVSSQVYHWVVLGAPFPYYRINLTGSGTEVISIAGKLLSTVGK
jgi:hypothetical protein